MFRSKVERGRVEMEKQTTKNVWPGLSINS
jgi:hypothetical protein